jgi:hypothetical protein
MSRKKLPILFAAALVATAVAVGIAYADDTAPEAQMPPVQKQLQHPVATSLTGEWTTVSTSPCGEGKGKASFRLGVGGTVLLEDYENTGTTPEGQSMTFHGHGIYKVSDDAKTITVWWIDDYAAEPVKISGPLTDKGFEMSGDTGMGHITIKMEKSASGFVYRINHGGMEMTETYSAAK